MVRWNEHSLAHLLPRDGFAYGGCAPLFPGRGADARCITKAMKKGDQGGPLQPAVVDKCLEELFAAATEHATLTRNLATWDNLWARVADQIGWAHLPPIIIRHLADHMVEARLRAQFEGESAPGVELGLAVGAIDEYVDKLRASGLAHILPKIMPTTTLHPSAALVTPL
jgi:hypothetical protein